MRRCLVWTSKRLLTRTWPCWGHDFGLPASRIVRKKKISVAYKPPSVWYFVYDRSSNRLRPWLCDSLRNPVVEWSSGGSLGEDCQVTGYSVTISLFSDYLQKKKKSADDECLRSCLRPWIEESCISRIPTSYDFSQGTHNCNPRTELRQAHRESVLEWEGASEGGTRLSADIHFSGDSGFPLNPRTLLCKRTLVSQKNSRRHTVAPNSCPEN